MIHHVAADRCHVLFDASLPPVLTIDSGDTVVFRTLDACWGEVRSVDDFLRYRRENTRGSNPITGPVFIRGSMPGHTLKVEILGIELDPTGFQLIGPERGMIQQEVPDWKCYEVHISDGYLMLGNGLTLPINPVIGEMGNAPARAATAQANPCGGNIDVPFIRQGATVFLPIEVEGALFSVGDVHARQGDGEIVGAPEIGATVSLRLTVVPQKLSNWPHAEDLDNWYAIASAATEGEAIRIAVFEAANIVCHKTGIAFEDSMIYLTMSASIHCCRTGLWGVNRPVAAIAFPKKTMECLKSLQPMPHNAQALKCHLR